MMDPAPGKFFDHEYIVVDKKLCELWICMC